VLRPKTRISRAPNTLAERVRGSTVVLDPERGRYVRLNATGAALWESLEAPTTIEELSGQLSRDYGVDAARADGDAAAFVAALADRELVELSDS
jgi:hypothetical protein